MGFGAVKVPKRLIDTDEPVGFGAVKVPKRLIDTDEAPAGSDPVPTGVEAGGAVPLRAVASARRDEELWPTGYGGLAGNEVLGRFPVPEGTAPEEAGGTPVTIGRIVLNLGVL